MTATQSLKIYEILQRHFNNNDDAKTVVQEIEQIIETKLTEKSNILATKEDILSMVSGLKQDLLRFQIDVEKRFNTNIIWIVGTGLLPLALYFQLLNYLS